jgi:hypothetical protein
MSWHLAKIDEFSRQYPWPAVLRYHYFVHQKRVAFCTSEMASIKFEISLEALSAGLEMTTPPTEWYAGLDFAVYAQELVNGK